MGIDNLKTPMDEALTDACDTSESPDKSKILLVVIKRIEKAMQLGAYKRVYQMLEDARAVGCDTKEIEDRVLQEIATSMLEAYKSDPEEAKQMLQNAKEAGFEPKEIEKICNSLRGK